MLIVELSHDGDDMSDDHWSWLSW